MWPPETLSHPARIRRSCNNVPPNCTPPVSVPSRFTPTNCRVALGLPTAALTATVLAAAVPAASAAAAPLAPTVLLSSGYLGCPGPSSLSKVPRFETARPVRLNAKPRPIARPGLGIVSTMARG